MSTADDDAIDFMLRHTNGRSEQCAVGQAISELDAVGQATLTEALWGKSAAKISATAIMAYAREKWGWTFHASTLRVHRRGDCTCDQPS